MTTQKEIANNGPVTTAMRIGGSAMVCKTHDDGTEFGYPLLCAEGNGLVRKSTGVVRKDGEYTTPTSEYWIVDGTTITPFSTSDVMAWDLATAWRYRLSQVKCTTDKKRKQMVATFTMPGGVVATFLIECNGANIKPINVKFEQ